MKIKGFNTLSKGLWYLFLVSHALFIRGVVLIIIGFLFYGCLFYIRPNCDQIENRFYQAIECADCSAAFKYARLFERREKKIEDSQLKHSLFYKPKYHYKRLYAYAYELNEEYDKALKLYGVEPDLILKNEPINFVDKDFEHPISRLLYKKGRKREAFLSFCTNPPPEHLCDEREFTRFQSDITLQSNYRKRYNSSLSCFKTYKSFLNFLDEEYEKLGRPEEYADAVEKYHAIATDEPGEELKEAPYDPKPHAVYYGPSPELLKQTGNTTNISKKNLK